MCSAEKGLVFDSDASGACDHDCEKKCCKGGTQIVQYIRCCFVTYPHHFLYVLPMIYCHIFQLKLASIGEQTETIATKPRV